MGNSSSFGLGGGATRSSRDVRLRDPEKEVERPPASRALTHNEYEELPASQKPHSISDQNTQDHPRTTQAYKNWRILSL